MLLRFFALLTGLLAACSLPASAQPLQRLVRSADLWSGVGVEKYFPKGSFYWGEIGMRSSANGELNQLEALPAYWLQAHIGYEHRLTRHWSAGAGGRVVADAGSDFLSVRPYIRHTGRLFGMEFIKQAQYEWFHFQSNRLPNDARMGGYMHLARNVRIGGQTFRPQLSYEVMVWQRRNDPLAGTDRRRIDRTRLRADWMWFASEKMRVSAWAMRQTEYYFALESFDQEGNLLEPFRRLNVVLPVVGLSLKWWIRPEFFPEKVHWPERHTFPE